MNDKLVRLLRDKRGDLRSENNNELVLLSDLSSIPSKPHIVRGRSEDDPELYRQIARMAGKCKSNSYEIGDRELAPQGEGRIFSISFYTLNPNAFKKASRRVNEPLSYSPV